MTIFVEIVGFLFGGTEVSGRDRSEVGGLPVELSLPVFYENIL